MPVGVPYIIYQNTIFLRKIKGGFELVPTYDGEIDLNNALPDIDYIERLLKRRKFKGKKTRFCLVRQYPSFEGEKVEAYEALPDWGLIASNLWGQVWDQQTVESILEKDYVEAIVWISAEGDVEYVTRQVQGEESAPGQAEQMPTVHDVQSTPWDQ